MRQERHRGGQPGNQNARRHGFYSKTLSPNEICRFWSIVNTQGVDPEIAALRIKLHSVLQTDPGNRRVLLEGVKLLAKWVVARNRLDRKGARLVKREILRQLEAPAPPHSEPAASQTEGPAFSQHESGTLSQLILANAPVFTHENGRKEIS